MYDRHVCLCLKCGQRKYTIPDFLEYGKGRVYECRECKFDKVQSEVYGM